MTQKQLNDYINQTIQLSRICKIEDDGKPHPFVGALICLPDGRIFKAYRGELKQGEHAEYTLLQRKCKDVILTNSVLFTTLEPCTERKPPKRPCVDWIIDRGIKEVWIGMLDPNRDIYNEGFEKLQKAGIKVQKFPDEFSKICENINYDFARRINETRKQLTSANGFEMNEEDSAEKITNKMKLYSLDDWYYEINTIYRDRNSNREVFHLFSHLVEIIGGLGTLASDKKKENVDINSYIPKALAWWFSLCGKLRIESVEELVWSKYPGVCPYCLQPVHTIAKCKSYKNKQRDPDWKKLNDLSISSVSSIPQTLIDWQKMFASIYTSEKDDKRWTFARLAEELGELAEAIRVFDIAPGYFISEAADVFAWIMHIQNDYEIFATEPLKTNLVDNMINQYPQKCIDCNQSVCSCLDVLSSTIGRIGHEIPIAGKNFFASPEKWILLLDNKGRART